MSSENIKLLENLLILFIGIKERPVPSRFHIQKEFFIFVNSLPNFNQILFFENHYNGPYCGDLKQINENPFQYSDIYFIQNDKISLNEYGKEVFKEVFDKYSCNKNFRLVINSFSMIRDLYDNLSEDELLYLIYQFYPSTREKSNIFSKLDKSKEILLKNIFKKGIISEERYLELLKNE